MSGGGPGVIVTAGSSDVTVLGSTFANDTTLTGNGGAISVFAGSTPSPSSLEVAISTISGSQTLSVGGGIYTSNTDTSIFDSTIADNGATFGGGGIYAQNGTAVDASLLLGNDLIASNTTLGDVGDCQVGSGETVDDLGHNLLSQPGGGACDVLVNGENGDQVGTTTDPINLELGPLAANGGPTETQALLVGSPAVDAGDAAICLAAPVNGLDQRGLTRDAAARGVCDIGAYDTAGA